MKRIVITFMLASVIALFHGCSQTKQAPEPIPKEDTVSIVPKEPEKVPEPVKEPEPKETETTKNQPITPVEKDTCSDYYGSYQDNSLSPSQNNWESLFGQNGWKLDKDLEEDYGFVPAYHDDYPDVTLYLYGPAGQDGLTAADIQENGFFGYAIDASYSEKKPEITWGNGQITFGATTEMIQAVYGQTDDIYEGETFTVYTYHTDEQTDLSFYIWPEDGLQSVEAISYEMN